MQRFVNFCTFLCSWRIHFSVKKTCNTLYKFSVLNSHFNLIKVFYFYSFHWGATSCIDPNTTSFFVNRPLSSFCFVYGVIEFEATNIITNLHIYIFSWNEESDVCFNVEYVLLGHNFDFFGGYCSLPSGYYWLQHVTWWLLIVTGGYCSLPLATTRSHF